MQARSMHVTSQMRPQLHTLVMQTSPCCMTNETRTLLFPARHYQHDFVPILASRGPASTLYQRCRIYLHSQNSIVSGLTRSR